MISNNDIYSNTSKDDKKRIEWVDILRGISMILIVYWHIIIQCDKLSGLTKYMATFHIPIFFMISGFVFKIKEDKKYKSYIWEKFKRLMVPYFVFAFLFLIPFYIFEKEINICKSIFGIFYGNGNDGLLKQNSPLWFLPCIFISYQFFYWIEKFSLKFKNKVKNIYVYICSSLLFLICGFISYFIPHFRLPWGIDVAIVLSFFFYIGKIIRIVYGRWKNNKYYKAIGVVLIIIGFIVGMNNAYVTCMNHIYGNYWLFIISASATSVGIMFLIQGCKRNKIIEYIGNNTIGILIFHKLVIVLFQSKLGVLSTTLLHGNVFMQILLSLLVLILSIVSCLIPIVIIKKFFPGLLGEYKVKKNTEPVKIV